MWDLLTSQIDSFFHSTYQHHKLQILGTAGVIASLVVLCIGLRRFNANRIASQRVDALMLPAKDFDPDPTTVKHWVKTLSAQLNRGWFDWIMRPAYASAVRFTHLSTTNGAALVISVPRWGRELVETPKIPGIELRNLDTVDEIISASERHARWKNRNRRERFVDFFARKSNRRQRLRSRVVLGRSDIWPLADSEFRPTDQISALVSGLSNTDQDFNVEACLDIVPLSDWQNFFRRRRIERKGRAGKGTGENNPTTSEELAQDLFIFSQRQPIPVGVTRQVAYGKERELANYAFNDEALFRFQLQVAITETKPSEKYWSLKERMKARMKAVSLGWRVFAGTNNYLVHAGLNLFGRWQADLPIMHWFFDRRAELGWCFPSRGRSVVSGAQIGSMLVPPTKNCVGDPWRVSVALAGECPLPALNRDGLIPLGKTVKAAKKVLVGVEEDLINHSGGFAASGSGKSTLLVGQIWNRFTTTKDSIIFLDPHGDTCKALMAELPAKELERVVRLEFDLPHNVTEDYPILGWNPLATKGLNEQQTQTRMKRFNSMIVKGQSWTSANSRAQNLLAKITGTVFDLSRQLPAELAPTIFQLLSLLENERWRQEILPFVKDQELKRWWRENFSTYSQESLLVLANIFSPLREYDATRAIFGQSIPTYKIEKFADCPDGRLVLLSVSSIDESTKKLAGWLAYEILYSALERKHIAEEKRHRVAFYVDELQAIDSALGTLASQALAEVRKFRYEAHLWTQSPDKLSEETRSALFDNASMLLAGDLSAKASTFVAKNLDPDLPTTAFVNNPPFEFVGTAPYRRGDGQIAKSRPFRIETVPLEQLNVDTATPSNDNVEERYRTSMKGHSVLSLGESLEHQRTLDNQIINYFKSGTPPTAKPTQHRNLPEDKAAKGRRLKLVSAHVNNFDG